MRIELNQFLRLNTLSLVPCDNRKSCESPRVRPKAAEHYPGLPASPSIAHLAPLRLAYMLSLLFFFVIQGILSQLGGAPEPEI